MVMSSKVMYGVYNYGLSTPAGDIGTASFDGSAITVHAGVAITNIGPDSTPFYFQNSAGNNRGLLASITYSGSTTTCNFLIYQADADNSGSHVWGDPVYGPAQWTVSGTAIMNPYRFQVVTSSGTTYIYGIDYDATYTMTWYLFATDMGTITGASNSLLSSLVSAKTAIEVDSQSDLPGYLWALLYSESTSTSWFAQGNDLAIYSSGTLHSPVAGPVGISSLTTLGSGSYLNAINIYGGEVAPALKLKGYISPVFASNSVAARIARKKLLELISKKK